MSRVVKVDLLSLQITNPNLNQNKVLRMAVQATLLAKIQTAMEKQARVATPVLKTNEKVTLLVKMAQEQIVRAYINMRNQRDKITVIILKI